MKKKNKLDGAIVHPAPLKRMKKIDRGTSGTPRKTHVHFDATPVFLRVYEDNLKMAYELGKCYANLSPEKDMLKGINIVKTIQEEK